MRYSFGEFKYLLPATILVLAIVNIIPVHAQMYYGSNNTSINYNAESYQQEQNQIKTMMVEKQMTAHSDKWMSDSQQKNKQFVSSFIASHPYPTVNQTITIQMEKRTTAFGQSGYMFEDSMTTYDHQVKENTRSILAALKDYNSIKTVPAFTNCAAFHDCLDKPFLPSISKYDQYEVKTNSTGMQPYVMKPEFVNNTGFVVSTATWIHNMQDLQKFMTNSTK